MSSRIKILLMVLLLMFPITGQSEEEMVSVNGFSIPPLWTQAYYKKFLHISDEYKEWLKPDPGCPPVNDEILRNTVIKFVLIDQEARKQGVMLEDSDKKFVDEITEDISALSPDSDPMSLATLEVTRLNRLNNAYTRQLISKVTAEEIQKEYDRMLLMEDPLVVNVPFIKVRSLTLDTKDEAEKILSDIKKGNSYDNIASKLDPQYDLAKELAQEWIPASKHDEVVAVIDTIKKGDTIGPYRSMYGWTLAYLDDKKIISEVPLNQKTHLYYSYLKGKIRTRVHYHKLEGMYRNVRARADVKLNGKQLAVPHVLFYHCD